MKGSIKVEHGIKRDNGAKNGEGRSARVIGWALNMVWDEGATNVKGDGWKKKRR